MDLKRTYAVLIRLYPKDYQFRFEAEMLKTFSLSVDEHRHSGGRLVPFAARELIACMRGAAAEWIAKFKTDTSTRSRHLPDLRMMHLPWLSRETRSLSLRKFRCSSDTSR